ncbi:hypothetical protein KJI95_16375 [Shewanella sp. JM162201]|uniref:Uncharacterized protein n=1 Tax=Shewanella jiangmenensis TaxID=2837387 RepID=A0ABS5V6L3_9GAMM|nr:hypothetical protein [Shewanella jiangmenensis]MBT1446073.1 hypothetical protein [Shewanella jiangmenensis]
MKGKFLLGSCSLLLAACGGGSGDSADNSGSGGTNTARLVGDFMHQAIKCDVQVPNSDAKIILHKKDGSVLATHKPNGAGHLDIAWPADAAHVTLVTSSNGQLDLDTELERGSGDLGNRVSYDAGLDLQCECKTLEVNGAELTAAYPDHKILLRGSRLEALNNMEFCKVPGGQYASVDLLLTPTIANDKAYGALLDVNQNNSSLVLTADLVSAAANEGVVVSFYDNYDGITRAYTFGLNKDGRRHLMRSPELVSVFPGIHSNNFLQVSHSKDIGDTPEGTVSYNAGRRIKVTEPAKIQSPEIANNEQAMFAAVNTLLQGMESGVAVNYDLSNIGTNRAGMMLFVRADELNWSLNAPAKGTFPDLQLPADLEAQFEAANIRQISFQSSGYRQSGGINALRQQLVSESRSGTKLRPAFFDNYDYEDITVVVY